MIETLLNETGIDAGLVTAKEKKTRTAEIYKICQDEVIKRLSSDPLNSWRVPIIQNALATHNYEGTSMELLAKETSKLVEKYF